MSEPFRLELEGVMKRHGGLFFGKICFVAALLALAGCGTQPDAGETIFSTRDLVGYQVRDEDGQAIGPIRSLVVNLDDGTIEYVVLELPARPRSYEDSVFPRLVPIPWGDLKPVPEAHLLVVTADRETVQAAPTLAALAETQQPAWDERVRHYWSEH